MEESEGNTVIINNQIRSMQLSGNQITFRYFSIVHADVQCFESVDDARTFYSTALTLLNGQKVNTISTGWVET